MRSTKSESGRKVSSSGSTPSSRKTAKEIREWYEKYNKRQEVFAAAKNAVKFIDLTKTETRTYSVFNKERLRNFIKNPKSNESNIRNLSRFLYTVSHPYRRLINYNAQMIDLTAQSIIPLMDISQDKGKEKEKVLKNYYDTLVEIEKINLASEIYKCLIIAWREDCFYGYIYEDETGFFIMPLDGDYCKVSSSNYDGTLNFAYDFNFFKKRPEYLEFWDREFTQKYNKYNKDATLRWQNLEPEKTICLKVNADDPTLALPPFLALLESVIDLVDLQSIQSIKDELSIYKLLVARLQPLSGTTDPDDFEVDIDTAIEYYNKFADSLPEYVSSAISPLPIEAIDFKGTDSSDTDMIANSMSNLFKISGGSLVLNDEKTGTTIYEAHILADTMNALQPLLPQIEKWINRYLTYTMGEHSKVKYMMVSPWTKKNKKKELIESAQYGVPVKMAVAALDGYSPLETLSMEFLENDILGLHEKWIPLRNTHTISDSVDSTDSESPGGKQIDSDELSDEGSETREESKNDKG